MQQNMINWYQLGKLKAKKLNRTKQKLNKANSN